MFNLFKNILTLTIMNCSKTGSNIFKNSTMIMGMGMVIPSSKTDKQQKIVGTHNCEDLLTDLKICLNTNKYLIECNGILDRYHRCLRNKY